jgi:very-short-patch-repair endonuclease
MRDSQKTKQARSLRQTAPSSEQNAWNTLRQLRKYGLPVRRQHPIDRYVVDFAIVSKKLVIELDGAAHAIPGRARSDADRQHALTKLGWRVLRLPSKFGFSAHTLMHHVMREVRGEPNPLTPAPLPPAGGGK